MLFNTFLQISIPDKTYTLGLVRISSEALIQLRSEHALNADYTVNLVIEYTKTTDIPFSQSIINPWVYSEKETVIGTWIDGRPIYRIVIEDYINDEVQINSESLKGIDRVIAMYGIIDFSNLEQHSIPSRDVMLDYIAIPSSNLYIIQINTDSSKENLYKNKKARVVIEYLKTTDTIQTENTTPTSDVMPKSSGT